MQITFYNYSGEPNNLRKSLGTGTTITGAMRGSLSVSDPIITAETIPLNANYCYITQTASYYYMDPPEILRTGIRQAQLHRDPLMTFSAGIRQLPAIAARAQTEGDTYSSYLPDPLQQVYTYKTICTRALHTFSYGNYYILMTAG